VQRRLDAEHVGQLVDAYQSGTTINDLAALYRINRATVLEHLKRQGIRRRHSRLRQADIDKAVRLYVAGQSVEVVAHELRVGTTTVRRALVKSGVVLRRRGRPSGTK
jgi:transposase-like protein